MKNLSNSISILEPRVGMVGAETTNLLSSTLCKDAEFLLNVYTTHIRPKLDYGSALWNMGYIGDMKLVEGIQRRWTRAVTDVSHLTYDERLRQLDLYSMHGRLLRADLIQTWKILNGKCAINPSDLFTPSLGQGTRGHALKLQVQHCRTDIRKRSFAYRVTPVWNSLSCEAAESTSLDKFKALIHRDLGAELFRVP